MQRYKFTIEYDGFGYVGWQRQKNGPSIQCTLEDAIYSFSGNAVKTIAAGRTDSGVHALGQVVHADLPIDVPLAKIRDAINYHLKPAAIAILSVEPVSKSFHARFSAAERNYVYKIINRRSPLTVDQGKAWLVKNKLNIAAMEKATYSLTGHHDFTTFRATQCQASSPLRTLDELLVIQRDETIEIKARARSFLHNQVRSIVGSLKLVGEGKWSVDDLSKALFARDRSRCGPIAPAHGLYLTKVRYPDESPE